MDTANWIEHRRDEDNELLGYICPVEDDRFVPLTVFGHPLGEPGDEFDSRERLDSVGLSYLADRWDLHLEDRDEPITVTISEASPTRLVVANADFGYEGNIGDRFVLDVPCTILTRQ